MRDLLLIVGMTDLAALVNTRQLSHGGDVVGRGLNDQSKFRLGLIDPAELHERPAKGNPRRHIRGMLHQASATHANGFVVVPGTSVFLGELRKRNRRRILLDPASKFFNPRVVGHPSIMAQTLRNRDGDELPRLPTQAVSHGQGHGVRARRRERMCDDRPGNARRIVSKVPGVEGYRGTGAHR